MMHKQEGPAIGDVSTDQPTTGREGLTEGSSNIHGTKSSGPAEPSTEVSSRRSSAAFSNEEAIAGILKMSNARFFMDDVGSPCVRVEVGDRHEAFEIRSGAFRSWLDWAWDEHTNRLLKRGTFDDLQARCIALARRSGISEPVYRRVASLGDEVWIDLGTDERSAVRVTAGGWSLEQKPGVMFVRPGSSKPLPVPERGKSILQLRKYVSSDPLAAADDDDNYLLVLMWLLAALRGVEPFPILVIQAQQGSGKSTLTRFLQKLVDPSAADLRTPPKKHDDLAAALKQSYVLPLDNLSSLSGEMSDALCRISTGGSLSKRRLFSDLDEIVVSVARPVILNGITDVCTRPDLLDRAITVRLRPIEDRRRSAVDLNREFDEDAPGILGALLDGLVYALRNHGRSQVRTHHRLVDVLALASNAESALELPPGSFMRAFDRMATDRTESALQLSATATALREFLMKPSQWIGSNGVEKDSDGSYLASPKNWMETLRRVADPLGLSSRGKGSIPDSPVSFSQDIRRIAPALSMVGVRLDFDAGTTSARKIRVTVTN